MSLIRLNRKWSYVSLLLAFVMLLATGCSRQAAKTGSQAVEVKATQVIQKDTPITYEFVGQVAAKDQVEIRAKVAGNIVQKMVAGGATVQAGQPLFAIDRKQYDAALLNVRATLVQSEATLSQAQRDLARYEQLVAQGAVSQQMYDNAVTQVQQANAVVEANRAKVVQAEADIQDTMIVSPLSGRIDVKDLSSGSFVQAGATTIATVSSVDPVFVQFSMSENEYLSFAKKGNGNSPAEWFGALTLILSDDSQYPLTGEIEQVDKGLAQNTGTLTLKAVFPNPQHILVPGMFGRVVAQGGIRQGAMMIPQRALQQILGKNFVTVVDADGKAESRAIKIGNQIGTMMIVEEGLNPGDTVVVEGFHKVQPGTPLNVTMIAPEELKSPVQK
ncbi:Multidrug efflux pump subunit AcrA [bioreactor metagenome]|uniref:Multidrug efflux pump subunit AcrA n=1 Tax=bioreactor metagenome TaxID=1076179 RepID=A0A644XPZ7_9ZZZZ|nr:efflux RND transporter periplasmic adaptor subunit [Negativicutes bacterium]